MKFQTWFLTMVLYAPLVLLEMRLSNLFFGDGAAAPPLWSDVLSSTYYVLFFAATLFVNWKFINVVYDKLWTLAVENEEDATD